MHANLVVTPIQPTFSLHAPDPGATDALGDALAMSLGPGDLVALRGTLGAGKSQLARAIIRARLRDPEAEVASPTYTLVNIYGAMDGEIWHADLYRIDGEEIAEIGLADALDHALLLVEWPERWPDLPERRLDIELVPAGDGRDIRVKAHGGRWEAALSALRAISETPGSGGGKSMSERS